MKKGSREERSDCRKEGKRKNEGGKEVNVGSRKKGRKEIGREGEK